MKKQLVEVREYGEAGHFCAWTVCRFHRHTHVGKFCVSTVGNYYPKGGDKRETMGHNRFFETMVFDLSRRRAKRWSEVDFAPYNSARAANNGHDKMVEKFVITSNRAIWRKK